MSYLTLLVVNVVIFVKLHAPVKNVNHNCMYTISFIVSKLGH